MAVERVRRFLDDAVRAHDGRTLVVIGHVATRYGLEHWSGDSSLDEIVAAPSEWRDIPIWRYEIHAPPRE